MRKFYLAADESGKPWVPRECALQGRFVSVPIGQTLLYVTVEPPFIPDRYEGNEPIRDVLLGLVDEKWTLSDIGKFGFMVYVYVLKSRIPTKNPDVKDLIRHGMGTLHKTREQAAEMM